LRIFFRAPGLAGQKTPTKRAKGHEADTQLAQNRNYLRLQITFPRGSTQRPFRPISRTLTNRSATLAC
jgi:hypothetical protein